jgi:MerR family transcriptional regulator, copper efflux regulator
MVISKFQLDIPVTGTFMLKFKFEVNMMLQIGALSDQTGVPTRTIRYYEKIGLLSPASRGENRYRLYDQTDAERLRFIKSARALDFSLQEIAQILAARDHDEPPCGHVMSLIQSHIGEIETRIRELELLKTDLISLYSAGQELPEDVNMRSCVCHLIRISDDKKGN